MIFWLFQSSYYLHDAQFHNVFDTGGFLPFFCYLLFCLRDALMTSTINCVTSFISGFAIFSILGYMAHEYKVGIQDVATEGMRKAALQPTAPKLN